MGEEGQYLKSYYGFCVLLWWLSDIGNNFLWEYFFDIVLYDYNYMSCKVSQNIVYFMVEILDNVQIEQKIVIINLFCDLKVFVLKN